MAISAMDVIILVAYLILTLFIGWYVSKKITGFDDFAVGGRSFGPFVLAATFGATNFSTWSMVGKPGVVYNAGISVSWIALNACACVLAAVVFVPVYRKLRYTTMSEIFEDRYDGRVRGLISIIWVIADTMNRFGVTTYAAAVIISMLFGVNLQVIILATAGIVLIYTYLGGLKSVVITDVIQFVLMWIGLFIGAIFIFRQFNGWEGLMASLPEGMMDWVPAADNGNGWPWILAMTLLGFPYFITSQFVMQRGLGAKTVNVARWGILLAGLIAIPMAIMEILPGLAAKTMLDASEVAAMNSDMVGPAIYMKLLPPGLLGIFFSALIAAGFSTADSALCASSTLITEDFYRKFRPHEKPEKYLKVTRMVTILMAVLGTGWALLVPVFGGALDAILNVISITDMPIFVMVILAVFFKKIHAAGALAGIVAGTLCGTIASITGAGGIQGLAVTTAASTLGSLVVGIAVSFFLKRGKEEENRLEQFYRKIAE
ncbi:MAG: sodium:solute symporter family protein [Lachnospiraceae bacterium]|nr:sodium:solute symporter family protein [Lachnospiraceae bacterium]